MAMSCLCGHPQAQHDPEDKVCDAHATEGLGRCPCPGFVPNDEVQLRVAWNRADLYDIAARERRAARDERDLYRKECERLRERLVEEEGKRLQILDDAGGIENERDALRREVRLLQKECRALHYLLVSIRQAHLSRTTVESEARGREAERAIERDAVVAFLREEDLQAARNGRIVSLRNCADAIQSGYHRNEEEGR